MTNGESYNELSAEDKNFFRDIYQNHPLFNYIDWEKYYGSADGNTLDFVKCYRDYTDDEGRRIISLDTITENGEDYVLVYVCGENAFYKFPDAG